MPRAARHPGSARALLATAMTLLLAACATPAGLPPTEVPPPAFPPGPPPPPMTERDAPVAAPALVGPVWAWQHTLMNDDSRTVPGAPDRYTLQFRPDGRVDVRADCNRGGGSYTQQERRLSFGPIALTRMQCAPGSNDAAFLKGLPEITSFLFAGDLLVLELKYDSGSMQFRALPR
jgi:heat shock protein HslJ